MKLSAYFTVFMLCVGLVSAAKIWFVSDQTGCAFNDSCGDLTDTWIAVINKSYTNASATAIKVTVRGHDNCAAGEGMYLNPVSICERNLTNGEDCVEGTRVAITFNNGNSNISIPTADCPVTVTSDTITFNLDTNKDYIIKAFANDENNDCIGMSRNAVTENIAYVDDNFNCAASDFCTADSTYTDRQPVAFDIESVGGSSPTVASNFTTEYIIPTSPLSAFHVLVNGTDLNATAKCDIVINSSVLTCARIELSNATGVGNVSACTPGSVGEYNLTSEVNCTGSGQAFNSSVTTFFLDTNSNPTITANFSDYYNNLSVPSVISVYLNGTNFVEEGLCSITWNDTSISCTDMIVAASADNVSTCTITSAIIEKNYSAYVDCSGLLYTINSSLYQMYINTSNARSVILNVSSAYNTTYGYSFDIGVSGGNWQENATCGLAWNSTGITCLWVDPVYNWTNISGISAIGAWDTYPVYRSVDGNLNTYARPLTSGEITYNFSKPINSSPDIYNYWMVKDYGGAVNLTIPAECYNTHSTYMLLKATATVYTGTVTWACRNATHFKTLRTDTTGAYIYESRVFYGDTYDVFPRVYRCFNYVDDEVSFNLFMNCNGTNAYSQNVNSSNYNVWVDTISPAITGSFFLGGNLSYHYLQQNITGVFSAADSNLWKVSALVDGVAWHSIQDIDTPTYTYYLEQNLSNLSMGLHNLTVKFWDSHTSEELKEKYNINIPWFGDSIEFVTSKNKITIKALDYNGFFSPFTAKKLKDRYTFSFSPDSVKDKYEFRVSSDLPLYLITKSNSKWKSWLVSGENNWIDFFMADNPNLDVKIKIVDEHTAIVTTKGQKEGLQEYSSVGELNLVSVDYQFYVYNITLSYFNPVFDGQFEYSTLRADFGAAIPTYATSFYYDGAFQTVSASDNGTSLWLNATFYAPLITATQPVEGRWWFNSSGDNNSMNFSQTVQYVYINDCDGADLNATVNISYFIEDYPSVPNSSSLEVIFNYWASSIELSKNVSYNKPKNLSHTFCLFPPNATLYTNAYFKYEMGGGFTHRYYLINQSLTNAVLQINAYNFNTTTGISDLKGTARYFSNYEYYENVYAALQRYYPAENVWRTVQMDRSGDFGLLFFNIIEQTVDYRFIFYDEFGNVIKRTQSMKFVCTATVCDLTFLLSPYASSTTASVLFVNDSFDNVSMLWRVDWVDNIGLIAEVNVMVSKETMMGNTTICDHTSSGAAGTLTCNVSGYTGSLFMQVRASRSPFVYEYAKWVIVPTQKLYDFVNTSEGALWSVGVVVTSFMFGLFSPVAGIVAMLFGLIAIYFLGLLSALSATFLVVACCVGVLIAIKLKR